MGEFTYIGTGKLIALGHSALRAAIVECGEDLVGKAQDETPVHTGTLKASIHTDGVRGGGASVSIRVQTGGEASEYAIPIHEGSRAHDIVAHGGGLFWKGAAHPVKRVHHPGNRPYKFLERPLIANRPVYRAFIAAAARKTF
jgi:hypothetical protein